MRAAARLEVNRRHVAVPVAANADGAHLAAAAWGLHTHAFDEGGVGVQCGIGDGRDLHRQRLRHNGGQACVHRVFVDAVVGHKINTRLVGRDGAAVDQVRHQVAQHVRCGVQAHQPVAARPVNGGGHAVAHLQGGGGAFGRHMQHQGQGLAFCALGFAAVDDGDAAPIGRGQRARIARLAAAQRVEDGAVEHDAGIRHRQHGGITALQVAICAKEFIGGGQLFEFYRHSVVRETPKRQPC